MDEEELRRQLAEKDPIDFEIIKGELKKRYRFASTLTDVVASHGENALFLLGFLDTLINPTAESKSDKASFVNVSRMVVKLIEKQFENLFNLLGFLNTAKNSKEICILPLASLRFHRATDSYYPDVNDKSDDKSKVLFLGLGVRNDILGRIKDLPSKRHCLIVDTRKTKIPTLENTDDTLYAWTTKFPDLFVVQGIGTVAKTNDRTATEYLAYIPKGSQKILAGETLFLPPCPYDQMPTPFAPRKVFRN